MYIKEIKTKNMKLLNNGMYLLLINEGAEIKIGDKFLADRKYIVTCKGGISKTFINGNFYKSKCAKIIAYYPLTSEAKEIDLLLLPPFEEKLIYSEDWEDYWQYKTGLKELKDNADADFEKRTATTDKMSHRFGYVFGAKSIEDKLIPIIQKLKAAQQFSLEDMKKAIEMARIGYGYNGNINVADALENDGYGGHIDNLDKEFIFKTPEEIIQSLSIQQLPKEFIPEYEIVYFHGSGYYEESQLSSEEREKYSFMKEQRIKTITNSKGREELVGIYKY